MASELTAIVEELGGEKAFGRPIHTEQDMNKEIRAGFPHSAVEHFRIAAGLSWAELAGSRGMLGLMVVVVLPVLFVGSGCVLAGLLVWAVIRRARR